MGVLQHCQLYPLRYWESSAALTHLLTFVIETFDEKSVFSRSPPKRTLWYIHICEMPVCVAMVSTNHISRAPQVRDQTEFNTLRPRQNGRYFADDIFKCIFLNENVWIPIKISMKFVPKGPINNIPALVQIVAWRRPGDKPLSEPIMGKFGAHICVSRPQWVNPF